MSLAKWLAIYLEGRLASQESAPVACSDWRADMATDRKSVRSVFLVLLVAVALGVGLDLARSLETGPIKALRTAESFGQIEGNEGAVSKFCGFAPCGMPLECK